MQDTQGCDQDSTRLSRACRSDESAGASRTPVEAPCAARRDLRRASTSAARGRPMDRAARPSLALGSPTPVFVPAVHLRERAAGQALGHRGPSAGADRVSPRLASRSSVRSQLRALRRALFLGSRRRRLAAAWRATGGKYGSSRHSRRAPHPDPARESCRTLPARDQRHPNVLTGSHRTEVAGAFAKRRLQAESPQPCAALGNEATKCELDTPPG